MKTNYNITSILRFLLLATLISVLPFENVRAAHLIGGELTYECKGNDLYDITLKIFRDCNCTGCAFFDNPAYVFIYDDAGFTISILEMTFPGPVALTYDPKVNPCLELPPDLCVEEAVYVEEAYLPPIAGGYHIVHQRCCRNDNILNIDMPSTYGATFYAHVPDGALATCNSNPFFSNFPPIALCVNDSVAFDHSATDIDGDSLVYELCAPYTGASQSNPKPDPGAPALPPPYSLLPFQSPYTFDAPLNGSPQMSIDPQTGILTGSPSTLGQFVVGVCVSEYRNGILLSTNKRDFQFNVVQCNAIATAALPSYLLNCGDTVNFTNNSTGGTFYLWDFGDGGTDTAEAPTHAYQDTGTYNVSLIVNSGWPCSDTTSMTVDIFPDLSANYSYEIHCADSDITFTDLSTTAIGTITNWAWSFGDGGSSTEASPVYNYAQGGTYNIQLMVINDTGCFDMNIREIYVYEEPPAMIFFNSVCEDSLITFNDDTQLDSGSVVSWNWDIAGFTSGSGSSISYTFDASGSYQITLSVVTNHGCEGTVTQTIVIDSCFVIGLDPLEEAGMSPVTVNPNPSKGLFNIVGLNYSKPQDIQVEVYEVTGRRVLKMTGAELVEANQAVDLQLFGSGLYFLKILEGKKTYSLKLVVH